MSAYLTKQCAREMLINILKKKKLLYSLDIIGKKVNIEILFNLSMQKIKCKIPPPPQPNTPKQLLIRNNCPSDDVMKGAGH